MKACAFGQCRRLTARIYCGLHSDAADQRKRRAEQVERIEARREGSSKLGGDDR